jgi:hypothetical protein
MPPPLLPPSPVLIGAIHVTTAEESEAVADAFKEDVIES